MEELRKIVKACLKNDRQMQALFYKMFASKMYGLCLRYARDESDAKDILQEGFIKVFDNLKNFKWNGSLEGWMKRIFVNLALDRFRTQMTLLSVDNLDESKEISATEASALDSLSEKEILQLIQNLPDQYRLVFNLYVMDGQSHKEIGEILGIGESTSRSNLARAKTILKDKIQLNARWAEKAI